MHNSPDHDDLPTQPAGTDAEDGPATQPQPGRPCPATRSPLDDVSSGLWTDDNPGEVGK